MCSASDAFCCSFLCFVLPSIALISNRNDRLLFCCTQFRQAQRHQHPPAQRMPHPGTVRDASGQSFTEFYRVFFIGEGGYFSLFFFAFHALIGRGRILVLLNLLLNGCLMLLIIYRVFFGWGRSDLEWILIGSCFISSSLLILDLFIVKLSWALT